MELRAVENIEKKVGSGAAWPVYRRILLAVDGSERSLRAGEHAVYLASSLGSELIVMSVGSLQAPALRRIVYLTGIAAETERESRDVALSIVKSATENGIRCIEWPALGGRLVGSPSQAVAAAAREVGAGCVVVGLSRVPRSNEAFSKRSYKELVEHLGCAVLGV